MTSAGSISGVNCSRENLTFRQLASDLTDSVLARPGTPSSRTCPLASSPIDQPLDQVRLADNDLAQFVEKGAHKGAGFLHCLVDSIDSGIHWS